MVANRIDPRAFLHQVADDAPQEVVETLATVLVRGLGQPQLVTVLESAQHQLMAVPEVKAGPANRRTSTEETPSDALEQARQRGLWKRRELLEVGGPPLTGVQVGDLLGLSRQAVDKRRRNARLLGVSLGRRGYAYPSWQFSQNGILPGLEAVLEDLHRHDVWMKIVFMVTPNERLKGATPLESLRQGRGEQVRFAAQAYGEHGAV